MEGENFFCKKSGQTSERPPLEGVSEGICPSPISLRAFLAQSAAERHVDKRYLEEEEGTLLPRLMIKDEEDRFLAPNEDFSKDKRFCSETNSIWEDRCHGQRHVERRKGQHRKRLHTLVGPNGSGDLPLVSKNPEVSPANSLSVVGLRPRVCLDYTNKDCESSVSEDTKSSVEASSIADVTSSADVISSHVVISSDAVISADDVISTGDLRHRISKSSYDRNEAEVTSCLHARSSVTCDQVSQLPDSTSDSAHYLLRSGKSRKRVRTSAPHRLNHVTSVSQSEDYWRQTRLPPKDQLFVEPHWTKIRHVVSAYDDYCRSMMRQLRGEKSNHSTQPLRYGARRLADPDGANQQQQQQQQQLKHSSAVAYQQLTFYKSLYSRYCLQSQGFRSLDHTDQQTILNESHFGGLVFVGVIRFIPYGGGGGAYRRHLANDLGIPEKMFSEHYQCLDRLSWRLRMLEIDVIEESLLSMLLVLATDFPNLKRPEVIENLRYELLTTFQAYITAKMGSSSERLKELLCCVPAIRQGARELRRLSTIGAYGVFENSETLGKASEVDYDATNLSFLNNRDISHKNVGVSDSTWPYQLHNLFQAENHNMNHSTLIPKELILHQLADIRMENDSFRIPGILRFTDFKIGKCEDSDRIILPIISKSPVFSKTDTRCATKIVHQISCKCEETALMEGSEGFSQNNLNMKKDLRILTGDGGVVMVTSHNLKRRILGRYHEDLKENSAGQDADISPTVLKNSSSFVARNEPEQSFTGGKRLKNNSEKLFVFKAGGEDLWTSKHSNQTIAVF